MADIQDLDGILDKLVKEVEAGVHALYRGEVTQPTAKARREILVKDARAALAAAHGAARPATPGPGVAVSPRPSVAAPMAAGAAAGWTREEGEAVVRCVMAWLPVGPPQTADPAGRCIPAMRDLLPTWGQRESAREAVKRISQP